MVSGSERAGDAELYARALARLRALADASGEPADAAACEAIARRLDPARAGSALHLARAAESLNASLALESVLERALAVAVEVTCAERGLLALGGGRIAARHGFAEEAFAGDAGARARDAVAEALASGEARIGLGPAGSATSFACVPLRSRSDTIGAIYLDAPAANDAFDIADRESLMIFAHQAALAIENARMFEEEREGLRRISALQAFQTRILEAIGSGVITFSPEQEITTFNRAAETTFGIDASRIVGKPANALAMAIPDFPEMFATYFRSGAVALRAEVEAMRSDGTDLTLEMRLSPLESAEGTGVAMVVTDVTQQRNLEVAHAAEIAKTGRVQELFSRYLAPHVVKSLMEDPGSIQLGGERTRATMFFADVRGFTSLAAQMPADRVVEILNTYFDEAVGIVFEHEGLLDKFYGDGLMAVFGPPRVRKDDAARAVAAAIALHEIVDRLRARLDYPLRISVGLATGDVVAGHFGSARRMDYTVIGDAVNLANGLQSAAPAGAIYCDEATIAAAGPLSRPAGKLSVRVKGRSELVTAYAIYPKASEAR